MVYYWAEIYCPYNKIPRVFLYRFKWSNYKLGLYLIQDFLREETVNPEKISNIFGGHTYIFWSGQKL